MCFIEILYTKPLFIYCLIWCDQQGISVVGASCRGMPQDDVHETLSRYKQPIFSYRIEVISLKSLHPKIGLDIDLVYPTSSFFTNIVTNPNWMRAITRCGIQRGRVNLLCARLCACRLFWLTFLTKTHS